MRRGRRNEPTMCESCKDDSACFSCVVCLSSFCSSCLDSKTSRCWDCLLRCSSCGALCFSSPSPCTKCRGTYCDGCKPSNRETCSRCDPVSCKRCSCPCESFARCVRCRSEVCTSCADVDGWCAKCDFLQKIEWIADGDFGKRQLVHHIIRFFDETI